MIFGASTARQSLVAASRLARTASTLQIRTFIAPTVSRRADFVQELYLKELKAYKPTPVKESDSQGHVGTFETPKAPQSPEEADLAASLKEYETMSVEVEGQSAEAETGKEEPVEDWLVTDDWTADPYVKEKDSGHH